MQVEKNQSPPFGHTEYYVQTPFDRQTWPKYIYAHLKFSHERQLQHNARK
jgi:hypothetical protein